jgi:hypothetical protein
MTTIINILIIIASYITCITAILVIMNGMIKDGDMSFKDFFVIKTKDKAEIVLNIVTITLPWIMFLLLFIVTIIAYFVTRHDLKKWANEVQFKFHELHETNQLPYKVIVTSVTYDEFDYSKLDSIRINSLLLMGIPIFIKTDMGTSLMIDLETIYILK